MSAELPHRPWGPAIATFLLTLLLGPPIGGIIFAICVAILPAMGAIAGDLIDVGDMSSAVAIAAFISLFAIPLSYFVGAAQAAMTGLAYALHGWLLGRPPFWLAVMVGLFVFVGALISGYSAVGDWYLPFLAIHLVPAIACWAITRLFWPEAAP
ncbi:MAG: hypothetical protein FJX63_06430 [Alphaproteobacteria bacterium]|nr:hypothetical protein [Alphaproteobacteria bacterium]